MNSRLGAAVAALSLAGAALVTGPTAALADYGNTAIRQVELSDNIAGQQGGGVWLWLELSSDHSVDYSGSDCGHGGEGAASDKGSATWKFVNNNTKIEIDGVVLNGLGGFVTTITVPATPGHYTGTDKTFLTLPSFIPAGIGNAQLQVAP
jgi:hypothetical protein